MRNVLLVIRADFGTFFATEMSLSQASSIIMQHRDGKLPPILTGQLPNGGCWSVDSKKIVICHTQELDLIQQQPSQQGIPVQHQWKLSGIN